MAKPKAPSAVGVNRDNNNFTLSWTKGAKYTVQQAKYDIGGTETKIPDVTKNTTSKVAPINLDNYHPKVDANYLTKIRFSVRGGTGKAKKPKWSSWSPKDYGIEKPSMPSLEATHTDEHENRTTFSWRMDFGENTLANTNKIFKNYKWWTILLQDSDANPEEISDWGSDNGVTADNVSESSKIIDETQVFTDNYSYTRFFKLVARGPAGDSDPVYAKHVYAFPNPARNVKATAIRNKSNQGYIVSVEWTADETKPRPIDSVIVEYAIETPNSSTSVTTDNVKKTILSVPSISNWTTAATVKDTTDSNGDKDGVSFAITGNIDDDKCIFVRVLTKHDNKTTPSDVVFVSGGYGNLSAPTSLSASVSGDTATVSVTNNSAVTASFVGIYYRTDVDPTARLIGIYPAGGSTAVSIKLPDPGTANSISLGAQTWVADYSPATPGSGVVNYSMSHELMHSSGIVWDDRPVPKPPTKVALSSPRTGVVRVTWDWAWTSANGVELSWSDHDDAWESTDEPQTYTLENTRACAWNVAGLDVGTWYFRVRLFKIDGDAITYGTYSDMKSIKIASTPPTPVLTISPSIVEPKGKVTCYWAFSAVDGDEQINAEVREAHLNSSGNPTSYTDIGVKANGEQYATIDISKLNWSAGTKHYLAVKVTTASGEESNNWSIPKAVQILNPIECTITSTSLQNVTVTDDDDQGITRTVLSLTTLPLNVSATGAGEGGSITYMIERAEDYPLDRPDERNLTGFKGETVSIIKKYADNQNGGSANYNISITMNDLSVPLDDNAKYNLIAIAQDSYKRVSEPAIIPFEVHWSRKAVDPEVGISSDNEAMVTYIRPILPVDGDAGDSCDIYRLSIDRPELIYENAVFGTVYVDPYPALGPMGGHRIVYKTVYGSYVTEDRSLAWFDSGEENGDNIDEFATIIDFDEDQIILPYDLSLSNRWSKDFTMTKYLGGSIEGDWNPAVERTGTIKTRVAVKHDPELLESLRRLADFAGICHVRTPDGSSFSANVNVSEDREEKKINMLASFSLEITRVDAESLDALTFDDWSGGEDPEPDVPVVSGILIVDTEDIHGGTIRSITGKKIRLQEKTVTASQYPQVIVPDEGYDGFTKIIISNE